MSQISPRSRIRQLLREFNAMDFHRKISDDEESCRSRRTRRFHRWNGRAREEKWREYQHKDDQDNIEVVATMDSSSNRSESLLEENISNDTDKTEIYIVYQRYGYFSILFSIAQTAILGAMMFQCGIAPLTINPMIGPGPDVLSEWGAKNAVLMLEDDEWWRLLTPILLHAGVIHLLCNVMVQIDTGAFFEREWGSLTWLIIYLVSAIGSSALSVVAMPDSLSVGSSGAVMGLFGGKAAEVICRFCESTDTEQDRIAHQVRKEQCAGVTCSIIIVMLFSFIPYVDWAAHLGGLIAGFCIGLILFALNMNKACCSKVVWLVVGIASTALYFGFIFQRIVSGQIEPMEDLRDVCNYYEQNLANYECNCQRN